MVVSFFIVRPKQRVHDETDTTKYTQDFPAEGLLPADFYGKIFNEFDRPGVRNVPYRR